MATFNFSTMQMTVKVVYYGPGLCGKTTNLQFIYGHTTPKSRGEMVSLETKSDRTLFFDLLPLEVGTIAGFKTKIQLYTVPGQVFYNTTRKLVLKGVDGIVFVADSQRPMLPSNVESLANLDANLAELGIVMDTVPLVLQYNKRDLQDICTVEELEQTLNGRGTPSVEAAAVSGSGVFETLRAISRLTLGALKKQLEEGPPPPVKPHTSAQRPAPIRLEPPAAAKEALKPPPLPVPTVVPNPRPAAVAAAPAAAAIQPKPAVVPEPTLPTTLATEPGGGNGVVSQDVLMKLPPEELRRARRLSLSLRLEDDEQQVVRGPWSLTPET
jgi:signal recognition particle receptor subunit beta